MRFANNYNINTIKAINIYLSMIKYTHVQITFNKVCIRPICIRPIIKFSMLLMLMPITFV